jgi:hypothetical protein
MRRAFSSPDFLNPSTNATGKQHIHRFGCNRNL